MTELELAFLRLSARRGAVPEWAKAEQMERSTAQRVLWHYDPACGRWI